MMKTYDETTQRVFQKMEEQKMLQNRKEQTVFRTAAVVCPVCLVAMAGIGIWRMNAEKPPVTTDSLPAAPTVTEQVNGTDSVTTSVSTEQTYETPAVTEISAPAVTDAPQQQTVPTVSTPRLSAVTTPEQANNSSGVPIMSCCDWLLSISFQGDVYVETRNEVVLNSLIPDKKLGTIKEFTELYGEAHLYSGLPGQGTEVSEDSEVYSVKGFDDMILLLADGKRFALVKAEVFEGGEDVQALVSLEIDELLFAEMRGLNGLQLTTKEKIGTIAELTTSGRAMIYKGFGQNGTVFADDAVVYTVQESEDMILVIQPDGEQVILSRP